MRKFVHVFICYYIIRLINSSSVDINIYEGVNNVPVIAVYIGTPPKIFALRLSHDKKYPIIFDESCRTMFADQNDRQFYLSSASKTYIYEWSWAAFGPHYYAKDKFNVGGQIPLKKPTSIFILKQGAINENDPDFEYDGIFSLKKTPKNYLLNQLLEETEHKIITLLFNNNNISSSILKFGSTNITNCDPKFEWFNLNDESKLSLDINSYSIANITYKLEKNIKLKFFDFIKRKKLALTNSLIKQLIDQKILRFNEAKKFYEINCGGSQTNIKLYLKRNSKKEILQINFSNLIQIDAEVCYLKINISDEISISHDLLESHCLAFKYNPNNINLFGLSNVV